MMNPLIGHVLGRIGGHKYPCRQMESTMAFFADITFLEVCATLLTIGLAERALLAYAPDDMVGPNGWLLRVSAED